jgi:Sec-independent protein translocase protein TatA
MQETGSAEEKRLGEAGKAIQKGLTEIRDALADMLPEQVLEHSLKARRERLLAWRSIIDARVASTDRRLKTIGHEKH